MKTSFYLTYGKRAMDIALSVPLLVVFSPLMAILAIAVKLTSKGPVHFVQKRLGLNGLEFSMLKFRSMKIHNHEDDNGMVSRDDPRFTPIGKWLRASHLDELPQLWHILRSEMSFVGPRPRPAKEYKIYFSNHPGGKIRISVKPGLTGTEQIQLDHPDSPREFRSALRYDVLYVNKMSWRLDLWILWRTISTVLFLKGR